MAHVSLGLRDRVLGCLVGGMMGDAAGATLEFRPPPYFTKYENVRHAMTMPGGGSLNVAPGQVTDDSELMMALARALAGEKSESTRFPADKVSRAYVAWHRSCPFDCGGTCGRAFAFATNAGEMMANAQKHNRLSQANGALMRCAPLACWAAARLLSTEHVAEAARQDALLSHPSEVCQDANAVFCVALNHLLLRQGDAAGALDAARAVSLVDGQRTVKHWLETAAECSSSIEAMRAYAPECKMNVGHAKHAFVQAFALLGLLGNNNSLPKLAYDAAMFEVLKMGGDTDTNACICGYIMGAFHGYDRLCREVPGMLEPVLAFDCTRLSTNKSMLLGHVRPAEYKNNMVHSLATDLL